LKVLLVQPPIEDFYTTRVRNYPLGLLYLATKVMDLCDVKVVDLRKGRIQEASENPFPELSEYFRKESHTPFSLFKTYKRYGLNIKEIERIIMAEDPDVLCVSSLFSAYVREAQEVARCAKEVKEGIVTVLGGHHASALPDHLMKDICVDYVIRGEGETPFLELLTSLIGKGSKRLNEIVGLCMREKGRIHVSDRINYEVEIDMIPERRFIEKEDYRIGKKHYAFMITSRGCPNFCAFCSRMPVPYRERSLKSVGEEIEKLKSQGIEWIDFEDDMLINERKRFLQILRILKGKDFALSAMNGLYIDSLDREVLKEMIDAGFRKVNLSIVDLSPSVLKMQGRKIPANFFEIISWIESSDLNMEIHFIVGLPNQKKEDVLKTVSYLSQRRCLLGPSIYYLSPNNPLVNDVLGEDWVQKTRYMRSSILLPVTKEFSRQSLFTFMKLIRFVNFLKRMVDERRSDISLLDLGLSRKEDDEIFKTLVREKRFIAYDTEKKEFFEEKVEREIVEDFFNEMEGKKIKGYKTPFVVEFRTR
jgi:radical SAM superfamily enzyme YgiQ (UPF0313 family)